MVVTETISKLSEITLRLFNVIITEKNNINKSIDLKFNKTLKHGFVLSPNVAILDNSDAIIDYLITNKLTGAELNKTFHKSWDVIKKSTRFELLIHQITHYMTTYGYDELGIFSNDTIYVPNEVLNVPDIDKLPLKVIHSITKKELIGRCLDILKKGIALKEETIDDIIYILDVLNFNITTDILDTLKNKEAVVKISTSLGIYPSNPIEFLRFLIYKAIDSTIIIKNSDTILAIQNSNIDISFYCKQFGLEKLSQIFLRYKSIFLAFKKSNDKNRSTINKLRKLSKTNHIPMSEDYLNMVTSSNTYRKVELIDNLNKVNNFRKIRLLYALHTRMSESNIRLYRIRNGKSFIHEKENNIERPYDELYGIVYKNFIDSLNIEGKNILLSKEVDYALPSSEKMFMGNFPIGTSFDIGEDALFGIYWKNEWGANDMDISAISVDEKIGWNSEFKNSKNTLMHSGDHTRAPNGASEYLYASNGLDEPYLIMNNIYSGDLFSKAKIIIAKETVEKYDRDYIVNPNNVITEIEITMNKKEKILGLFLPTDKGVKIIITDFDSGSINVSETSQKSEQLRKFLINQYTNSIALKRVLIDAGANIVYSDKNIDVDIDLTHQNLTKDSIIDIIT